MGSDHADYAAGNSALPADVRLYTTWLLAEQRAPIAIRKVFDELDGRLKP